MCKRNIRRLRQLAWRGLLVKSRTYWRPRPSSGMQSSFGTVGPFSRETRHKTNRAAARSILRITPLPPVSAACPLGGGVRAMPPERLLPASRARTAPT